MSCCLFFLFFHLHLLLLLVSLLAVFHSTSLVELEHLATHFLEVLAEFLTVDLTVTIRIAPVHQLCSFFEPGSTGDLLSRPETRPNPLCQRQHLPQLEPVASIHIQLIPLLLSAMLMAGAAGADQVFLRQHLLIRRPPARLDRRCIQEFCLLLYLSTR